MPRSRHCDNAARWEHQHIRKWSAGYTLSADAGATLQAVQEAAADQERFFALDIGARGSCAIDAFELCPEHLVSGVCRVRDDVRRPLETQAEFYVLMRVSGDASIEDRAVEFLSEAMDAGLITDGVLAQSGPQEDMLWKIRDHAIPNLLFEGDMIKQDAALPLEHVVEYISRVKQDLAARWPSAWLYSLGHVGDGNQHICVMGHDLKDRADIASHLNQLLWSLGGTISAEHGIGQLHRAELVEQKSADELRLMRQVKSLFDPTNMFNPNVMFLPPN